MFKFVGKFYSHAMTTNLRRQIPNFHQADGEPFHEAWDRFKILLMQCPHHNYSLENQMQYFYDGLNLSCQIMADNDASGAMFKKTPQEASDIYEILGSNSQQRDTRSKAKCVYELNHNDDMARQIAALNKKMDAMMSKHTTPKPVEVCSICNGVGHNFYSCPSSSEYPEYVQEQVNMMNSYNPRPRNDPFSNTYNLDWRDHPNFSWKNNANTNMSSQSNPPIKSSLEETMLAFMQKIDSKMEQHDSVVVQHESILQNIAASIGKLEVQVGQLSDAVRTHIPRKFRSQTEQAKAVTVLRSGKIIDNKFNHEVTDECIHDAEEEIEMEERS